MSIRQRQLNGHTASPDTPASYYYSEGDIPPPAPEDVEQKLRRVGTLGEKAERVAAVLAQEAADRRQMIGGVDNFWLLLCDIIEFNPACTSVYTLTDHVTVEMIAEQLSRQADKFPRYKQRLESVGQLFRGPTFVDVPDFNVLDHIHVRRLPEPAGKRELEALVGEFISEDWDLSRPLWDTLLVENYHDDEGGKCAFIAKGNHTLSDGQGFVISQLYLTSYYDDLAQMMDGAVNKSNKAKHGLLLPSEYSKSLKPLDPYSTGHPVAPLIHLFLGLLYWLIFILQAVFTIFWSSYQGVRMFAFFLFTFWRVEMATADQPHGRTQRREFSSSRVFSLQDVKLCQQAFSGPRPGYAVAGVPKSQRRNVRSRKQHVTLNDVVCAVMADVLADVIASKPKPRTILGRCKHLLNRVLPAPMGFFIPISLRQPGDWSLRNLSTASNVYLNPSRNLGPSTSIRDLHEHIHKCRYELSLFKHSVWVKLVFRMVDLTGQAPIFFPLSWFLKSHEDNLLVKVLRRGVVKPLLAAAVRSFPAILTNIPGPSKSRITISGVEVSKWAAIPPQGGTGTLGIGIMSYAGGFSIALSADEVPGSEGIARRICEGFESRFQLYVSRAKEVLDRQD